MFRCKTSINISLTLVVGLTSSPLPSFICLIAMLTSASEKMSVLMLGLVSYIGSTGWLDVLVLYEESSCLK